jgi:hypothetical protein
MAFLAFEDGVFLSAIEIQSCTAEAHAVGGAGGGEAVGAEGRMGTRGGGGEEDEGFNKIGVRRQ